MESLPSEVRIRASHLARKTGIDEADALSLTAEAWYQYPDIWRIVAARRCVEQRRRESGRGGKDRRALLVLDHPDFPAVGAEDSEFRETEDHVDLVRVIGGLDDADLAALARRYWLNIGHSGPQGVACNRAIRRARRAAVSRSSSAVPLTEQQREVLALVADGLSNAQIASRLNVAADTVKSRMERIAKVLGTQSRAHAVAVAMRAGWVT